MASWASRTEAKGFRPSAGSVVVSIGLSQLVDPSGVDGCLDQEHSHARTCPGEITRSSRLAKIERG